MIGYPDLEDKTRVLVYENDSSGNKNMGMGSKYTRHPLDKYSVGAPSIVTVRIFARRLLL